MSNRAKFRPSFKVWIEFEDKRVIGKGGAAILEEINRSRSISKTAENLGMSYRYVWNYLDEVKKIVGEPVVETFKGGRVGGGGAQLNKLGRYLLSEYKRISENVITGVSGKKLLEVRSLKISARNRIKGKVSSVKKDGVMAAVKIKVTEPTEITALISAESVKELEIKVGDDVEAVVKATEVMVAK
jgi:molybdate transport system regulatory protein